MITKEELERIASLANIYVAPESVSFLAEDLERMLSLVECVVTDADCFAAGASEETMCSDAYYREDTAEESLSADKVLMNAPETEQGCFLVRKRV